MPISQIPQKKMLVYIWPSNYARTIYHVNTYINIY